MQYTTQTSIFKTLNYSSSEWEYKLTQLRCSPCLFVGEIITFAEKFSGTLQDIFLKFDINKDKYLDLNEIDIIARWLVSTLVFNFASDL